MKKIYGVSIILLCLLFSWVLYKNTITPGASGLYSKNAILVSMDGSALMEKNKDEQIPPASLTKIMTAIIAIENSTDLNAKVTLPGQLFTELYEANASIAGFLPNEEAAVIDLLYGVMLPSGAEASTGLANHIAGSEENFVHLMNEKAKELEMNQTHFMNVTGLHDRNHYSSVADISKLLSYAIKNDIFKEIFTSQSYATSPSNHHPDGLTFMNSMFNKIVSYSFDNGEIIGGKTGYTEQAGLCLASLATINGHEYILVTAGADGNPQTEQYNITDAMTVYQAINH
ncbi:D-alanyl-D-alanine carboxypeptidase family protein [Cytobacillus purgationiresistens]|uniref:D-alanyl-D-alanine carboxypeptidase (Penicillin-binding protein 5/6) n=1 Tax=Cytobacillus purgationiresistens TaxID=863449 RepID=A0ABU0AIF5_9BACI|nr:D-alanyl-D-alanine carboxypeptidase [Cytobacillus purgationiresistens]MDQ0270562.1 D-alanyl-D-alanine carboxypeptidase (penicillin-binding protein 5/6) [Cytobacillus purgationiresistens]